MWQCAYRRLGPVSRGQFVSSPFSRLYRLAVVAIAVTAAVLLWPAPALHAGGVVGDGTPGSCDSNAFAAALVGGGAVTFNCGPAAHTILIAEQTISSNTVVDGNSLITLSGGGSNRLFKVNGGARLTLERITLSDGGGVREGGAILVLQDGDLVLRDSTVRDSHVLDEGAQPSYGGGITVRAGTALIENSRILSNTAEHGPGGIDNSDGVVTIENSVVQGNRASLYAGIDNGGDMTIRGTIVRDNVASGGLGGGLGNVNGTLTLQDSVVISNATTFYYGGGMVVNAGNVTIERTDIMSNSAVFGGGGLYIDDNDSPSSVVVRDSVIAHNFTTAQLPPTDEDAVYGGGIHNSDALTLERVDLAHNRSSGGAGLYNAGTGSVVVRDSLVRDNQAHTIGGGLWLAGDGEQSLTNVTIHGNESEEIGGGLFITSTVTIQNATLFGNRAPDGATVYNRGATTIGNSILAGPLDSGNCGADGLNGTVAALTSAGHNRASDSSCALSAGGDVQDSDPKLDDLADNGGATLTQLPQDGSPAIDNGANCAPADQRGVLRPQGNACDIGAVEASDDPPAPVCGGVFIATADAYLSQAEPGASFGLSHRLLLAKRAGADAAPLLSFNLDAMPADATVANAFLELAVAETPWELPQRIEVFDLAAGWGESNVTWGNQPATDSGYGVGVYGAARGDLRIDVSTLVARWLNGEVAERSMLLSSAEGSEYALWLESREGASSAGSAPRLVIECGPPAPPPVFDLPDNPDVPDSQQAAGLLELQSDSELTLTVRLEDGAVQFASFDVPIPAAAGDDPVARAEWFLDEYNEMLGIPEADEDLQMIRQTEDGMHVFFRQLHNGIPVLGAEIAVHMDEDSYLSVNGGYLPHVMAPVIPFLTAPEAEALALATSEAADQVTGDTQLRYVDMDLLAVPGSDTRLTWQVHLANNNRFAKVETVFVDAFTGEIVTRLPNSSEGWVLDLEDGNDNYPVVLCWPDEDDDIGRNDGPPESVNAWDNTARVYNYFQNTFGRNSYDGDEEQAEVNIHVQFEPTTRGGPNVVNASYGVCDLFFYSRGTTTPDIVAHEWGHAVDESEGKLIYVNDSGAIDESYADIFGYLVDPSSFLIGDGSVLVRAPTGGAGCSATPAARDMSNPPCFGHPDHVTAALSGDGQGKRPPIVANDNGFVHTNSGILNKAAFLIIQGGTFNGVEVRGMGRDKAKWLFYNVLVHRLTSGSNFQNARDVAVEEAISLANANPPHDRGFSDVTTWKRSSKYIEACIVRNAYAAVGIGNGDQNCDGVEDNLDPDADGDFVPNAIDNCLTVPNPGQENLDGDVGPNSGDACDPDDDNDGRNDAQDNCPRVANPGWANWNGDAEGDACDDSDSDSVMDDIDNCRVVYNPRQENQDGDLGPTSGDACDPDIDGDNVLNGIDNCPVHRNPGQEDTTELNLGLPRDLVGDACDLCPNLSTPDNADPDGDGRANPCDDDDDGDDWDDTIDNCPLVANPEQSDWDDNDVGFACDADEQAELRSRFNEINEQKVLVNDDLVVPVPICPSCSVYLPKNYETVINVQLDTAFRAAVVDSNADIVAKSDISNVTQVLQFNAAPFAKQRLPGVSSAAVDPLSFSQAPSADETRYYLIIQPTGGADAGRSYTLSMSIEEGIEPPPQQEIFLPSLSK